MDSKRKFQTGNIITISIAHLVHDTYSSFLAPLLPLLIEKFSISYSLAGLFTVFQRLPAILNPFIGLLADKFPLRYFLIAAPAITAISMSLLGAASTYLSAAVLLLIAGFGSALFHTPAPVMVKYISGNKVGRGMSIFMFAAEFARTLGPLLVLSAVSFWSLEETYKLIPIGLGASIVLFIKFRKIKISDQFKEKKEQITVGKTLKNYSRTLISLGGVIFFINMMKSSLTAFLPTYLIVKGESLWMAGVSFSILQFAGAVGTFSSGTISDKIGRSNTLLAIALALPFFMWFFILLGDFYMITILIFLGFFLFASNPVMLALINEIKSERPAFINGVYMTINFGISAATVTLVGVLGDVIGLDTMYKVVSFFPLMSVPFILSLRINKDK
ncbi:MAG: MFS transporter [Melioribacteraceae bacterium]|nr:MFS transporter [Melioribacteraceae bacterium]